MLLINFGSDTKLAALAKVDKELTVIQEEFDYVEQDTSRNLVKLMYVEE